MREQAKTNASVNSAQNAFMGPVYEPSFMKTAKLFAFAVIIFSYLAPFTSIVIDGTSTIT